MQANAALAHATATSRGLVERLAQLSASFARLSSAIEARQATAGAALPMTAGAALPATAGLPANNPPQSLTISSATAIKTRAQPTSPTPEVNEPYWQPSTPATAVRAVGQERQSSDESSDSEPASPAAELAPLQPASDTIGAQPFPRQPATAESTDGSTDDSDCESTDEGEAASPAAQLAEQPASVAALPTALSPTATDTSHSIISDFDLDWPAAAQQWPDFPGPADAEAGAASMVAIKHEPDIGPQVRHAVCCARWTARSNAVIVCLLVLPVKPQLKSFSS